jgi:hypothetical protein
MRRREMFSESAVSKSVSAAAVVAAIVSKVCLHQRNWTYGVSLSSKLTL